MARTTSQAACNTIREYLYIVGYSGHNTYQQLIITVVEDIQGVESIFSHHDCLHIQDSEDYSNLHSASQI